MSNGPTTVSVQTPVGRTSFLYVFRFVPKYDRKKGNETSLRLLFPKSFLNEGKFSNIEKAYNEVTKNAFNPGLRKICQQLYKRNGDKKPIFKDGDKRWQQKEAVGKGDTYAAYKGCYFLNLHRDEKDGKPAIVDPDKEEILNFSDFQAGDYARCVIELSAYVQRDHGPTVSVKLVVVQKVRTGDRFGGGVSTAAALEMLEEEPLDESEWGDNEDWADNEEF